MKKILVVLFLIFVPMSVLADELVLVKGKGVPVCEAHIKNLRSLELNEMVCERDESYPEENGITRPKWEEVNLKENKELVKKIHKFFSIGDQFGSENLIDDEKEFEKYFNNNILKYDSLGTSTVDIANNGKAETVMLYREPRCNVERNKEYNIPYSRGLFVLDKDKNLIDIKNTAPLLQNITAPGYDIKSKAQESNYRLYDVFFYKNQTYFDKWFIRDWTLTVYRLSKDSMEETCRFKYKKNASKKEKKP
jgi:hypothetical protein